MNPGAAERVAPFAFALRGNQSTCRMALSKPAMDGRMIR
jgi:hypothetical protein